MCLGPFMVNVQLQFYLLFLFLLLLIWHSNTLMRGNDMTFYIYDHSNKLICVTTYWHVVHEIISRYAAFGDCRIVVTN